MSTSAPSPAWLGHFARPPLEFRPVPFWSWNEVMEPAEVRRQCRVIREAGWGGAFLHARVGLRTEYLGEAWFAACAAAIDECKKIGLKVWLYDEEGWPSGISGGSVPLAEESFRQKTLFARPAGTPAPTRSVPVGPPQHGLQIYRWIAPLGNWRFNGACFADLLSREAMAAFLSDAYAGYHRRFAADYGDTVVAEFLDEPCAVVHVQVPAGSLPYTDALFGAFATDHGYDPRPHLHLLFRDAPEAARFRIHYSRTASRLFEQNFTRQLADWCSDHRLALTGHYMEGGLYDQQCLGNAIPQNYRHQHIPGIDHLCMQVSEIITAKQCHGVVNQYAKPRMLCEAFGAAGQNLSFADRWWIGLHLLSLGVNSFVPHLALFTLAGCRKRDFPPNLFFQQPWWPANHAVDEPLTRLCVALAQGRPLAEALVLHPQESAAALLRVRTDWPEPAALAMGSDIATPETRARIENLDTDFQTTVAALLGAQRVFDLGDETILRDVGSITRTADGRPVLRVGAMDYPAVILPALHTLAESTFRLLKTFHAAGGPILLAAEAPALVEGLPSAELAALLAICPRVAPAALSAHLAPPLVRLEAAPDVSHVFIQIRELPNGERLVFLADRRRTGDPIAATVHLAGDFASVHRLDPTTGDEAPLSSATPFPITLHPASAHLLRLSPHPLPWPLAPPPPSITPATIHELPASAWKVERLDDNALTLDTATWWETSFGDFTPTPIPVVAIQGRLDTLRYTGPLALRYAFRVADLAPDRRVHLVVEYAERYRIAVNGTDVPLPSPALPPYLDDFRFTRLDITGLIAPGPNTVELHLPHFTFADGNAPRARQADRTGTEIEAIYLVGDFHVSLRPAAPADTGPDPVTEAFPFAAYTNKHLPPTRVTYVAADSLALCEPSPLRLGDVVPQCLPFYAGRLRLHATLPPDTARILQLASLDASVAELHVNGQPAGHVFASPLHFTLPSETDARAPARDLSLTLYSSLRNLLGPHHHESGEPVNTAPWFYLPYCGDGPDRASNTLAWSHGAYRSPNHRASYACVSFGHVGAITLRSS